MSKNYKIAVIPGDGTGPEVVAEAVKVLDAAGEKFGFTSEKTYFNWGGEHYLIIYLHQLMIRLLRQLQREQQA